MLTSDTESGMSGSTLQASCMTAADSWRCDASGGKNGCRRRGVMVGDLGNWWECVQTCGFVGGAKKEKVVKKRT
eukprot:354093-Chlamydomonas_euryale.AAC.2